MSDEKVTKLDFSEEFIMQSAERRYESGDYLGALTMLNKRAEMYDPTADASALYADIYEALGLYPLCADAWFRFLDTCNEADFSEGYEGLSVAFMNMGDTFQSEIYFRRTYDGGAEEEEAPEEPPRPQLRLVHSEDGSVEDAELLRRGIEFIKQGDLSSAQETFAEISPESRDFPSASGLTAMCLLLEGNVDGAAEECEKLIGFYPENIHALTTYCAVLGAKGDKEGAKEIGRRLAALEPDAPEDLFRVATALCETGLDAEAYDKLTRLKEKIPYGDDVLWFHAVAASRTGRPEEAVSSLERMTTVYPRKAVAKFYLSRLREQLDGGEPVELSYFYRMPDKEYKEILGFLTAAASLNTQEAEALPELSELEEDLRIVFDQLDGRDDKAQELAVGVAVKCRCDSFLREILLDYNVGEDIKFPVLCDLVLRNEENSFGVVVCSFYREFFTHKLGIGNKKRKAYLSAFAEVYSKYALLGEEYEEKLVGAAEDVYRTLEEADALDLTAEKEALAAVIYREARLRQSERSIEAVAKLFEANVKIVKEILNYII